MKKKRNWLTLAAIILVMYVLFFPTITPELAIRKYMFFTLHPIKAFTAKLQNNDNISSYGNQYYVGDLRKSFISVQKKSLGWYVTSALGQDHRKDWFLMKKIMLSILLLLQFSACSYSFHQETWLQDPEKRNGMVRSLINQQHELKGMTEQEIIQLLGEPAEKLDKPTRQFVYYLGRAGFGVDDSLFRLTFKNGKLESHEVTHD